MMVSEIFVCNELSANPELNQIVSGDVHLAAQSNQLQITQNTQQAIINWNSFNVTPQESVNFQQPTSGVCLNRINSANGMSQIHGQLSATGRVLLINEAGVLFGETAKVNVGSIIASTIDIANENFANGKYVFDQATVQHGAIINRGSINTTEHGLVGLLGSSVANEGAIQANLSKVIIAAGDKFALDFYNDGVINFAVNAEAIAPGTDEVGNVLHDGVNISGKIIADAGDILITGNAVQGVFDNLINMNGAISATSVIEQNGKIVLLGDSSGIVKVTGELNAAGGEQSSGGKINILGTKVVVDDNAVISTAGQNGGGEILIGGDYKGRNYDIQNALDTFVGSDVKLNADALTNGDGGRIIIWSDKNTKFYGHAAARGGALKGNGGFLEVSSAQNLTYDGSLDLSAVSGNKGNVLFDPRYLVVATGGATYSNGVNNLFSNNVGSTNTISPTSIVTAAASANITLQANTDVVFTNNLALTTSGSTLTVNAGRSVIANANVSTTNAAITMTANDTNATSSDRNTTSTGNPAGDSETTAGNITFGTNRTLGAGTGAITMTIGSSSTAPFSPGSISLGGAVTGGNITLTSPNAVNSTNTIAQSVGLTVSIGANSTMSGIISGAGIVTLANTSTATLTLSANNTFTGGVAINGGFISIAADRRLGAVPGAVTPGYLTFGGGTLITTANFTLSANRGIATGTGATLAPSSGTTLTYGGAIAGSGSLTMNGAGGTFILSAASTGFTGATFVTAGTLQTNVANAIPNTSALVMSSSSAATFNMNNNNQTVGSLSGGSSATVGNISLGTGVLTINQTTPETYSGVISGTGAGTDLILSSSSTNTLTLANTNTYTGATTINGGVLAISQDTNLGATPGSVTANQLNFGGGTLRTKATFALSSNRGITLNTGGGTILADPGTTLTYNGIIAGAAGNTFTASGSATSEIILGGVNTYSGETSITNGILSLTNASALGGSTSIGITSGAQLDLNFNSATLANTNTITLNDGGVAGVGGITFSGTSITLNNPITLASTSAIGGAGSGSVVLGGTISGGFDLSVNLANAAVSLPTITLSGTGALSVSAGGNITQTGVATVPSTSSFNAGAHAITLNQNNVLTGAVSLSNSGTNNVSLNNTIALALGTSSIGQNLSLTAGGSITQIGALTATGGTTTLIVTAAASDILLSQANNLGSSAPIFAGTVTNIRDVNIRNINAAAVLPSFTGLSNLRNLTVTFNNAALTFPAITLTSGGSLTAIAGGAITQSGVLTVPGTSSFTTNAFPITLTQNNAFTGAVNLNNSGANNVSLTNNGALVLGTSSIGQNLTIIASGAITQTGGISVQGTSSFTAGANPITLTQANGFIGAVSISNSGANNVAITNGIALVFGTSGVGQNLTATATGAITQTGILTVPGTSNFTAGANPITLNLNNVLTGAVTLSNSGSGNVASVTNSTALILAASNIGSIAANATGSITQSGVLTVAGTANFNANANPITLTASNAFTGAVSLNNTGSNNVSLTNGIALVLGASSIGQNLTVSASGAITQTGAVTVAGTASFTAGSNPITLTQNNAFTGAVTLSNSGANAVAVTNSSALVLAASTVGQNLTLTAGGSITQTGALTATGGTLTLSSSVLNSDILLSQANNLGAVAPVFTGTLANIRDVNIRNTNAAALLPSFTGLSNLRNLTVTFNNAAIVFPAITLTNSGVLTATSGGAISQTGALTVPGTSTFTAGANPITLTQSNALIGAVTVSNSGLNNISLANNTGLVLAASSVGNNFTATANGSITQTGVLTIPGTSSFSAGANAITLTQTNSFTGAVALSNSGSTNTASITNGSALILAASNVGALSATAAGSITQTGILNVTGTSTFNAGANPITLTQNNAFTGAVSLNNSGANDVALTNGGALVLGSSSIGRNLTVITAGAISQSSAISVPGTASFSAGANAITLTQNNTFTGAVTLSNSGAANNVSITNSTALILAASSLGNNFSATASGAITQTGVLTVPGTASFSAGTNAITLTQNNLFTGAISLNNSGLNDVGVTNAIALKFGTSSIGRNLTATASGAITQTGALTVAGTASFSVGSNPITLTQNNLFTGAVSLSNSGLNDVAITNATALVLNTTSVGRNLTVNASGPITQSGIITVSGTSSFNSGSNSTTLTLNNVFTGAVSLATSGANNASITNSTGLIIGASSIGNNLTVNASGAISQNAVISVLGTSSFSAGANPITLSQNNNFVGAVTLNNSGTNNVILNNTDGLTLGTSSIGNNLTINAVTFISQSGVLTVGGTSSFAVSSGPITLTASNAFTGAVSLSNGGNNNVAVTNAMALALDTSTIGGNFAAIASGPITQTGAATVTGTSSFSSGANPITLTQNNTLTGAVTFSNSGANDVSVTNSIDLIFAASNIGRNLTTVTTGTISQTGALTVPGTATFSAGSNAITLPQANAFSGAVSLSNTGANNVIVNNAFDLSLGTSSIGNNLTVTATGAISQTGVLTVPGRSSFTAGANAIALTQNNVFTGAVSLSNSGTNNVAVTNSTDLVFGTSTIGQNLSITSGGSLSQTGTITVPGIVTVSLTSPNSDVILPLANDFGTFPPVPTGTLANFRDLNFRNINSGATLPSLTAGLTNIRNVTVVYDNAPIIIPGVTLTSGGNLSITAGGAITQSAPATVPGTASFITGSFPITLTQANAFTGEVTLDNTGINDVSITNTLGLILAATELGNNFTVNAGGAISQTGGLVIGGTSSFTAGANPITLTQTSNLFNGAISLSNSGANDVILSNGVGLGLVLDTSTIGQNLTLSASGNFSQAGALTANGGTTTFIATAPNVSVLFSQANDLGSNAPVFAGTLSNFQDINLRNINASAAMPSFTGLTNVRNITITFNNAAIVFPSITLTNAGALVATAGGPITQTGALSVQSTSSFNAGANPITLTQNNNFVGAVTLSNSGSNDVSITNGRALILAASTLGRNLTVTTSGAITQTGILTIPGTASFSAGANPITLTRNNVFTGAVSLNNTGSNAVSIINSAALVLGASTVGGSFSVTAGGSITQTGALIASGAATTLSVTALNSDILLSQANDLGTSLPIFGGTLSNIRDVNIRDINTGSLVPSFTSLTNLRNLTLTFDNAAMTLPAIALTNSGNLVLTAGGAITQTGILTVPGTASFSAGAHTITLTQNNVLTGAVTLNNSGSNAVTLNNNRALVLAASTVGNNLLVTANGAITQTGALNVPGTSSFSVGARAITLTQNNTFVGAVSLSNSGANDIAVTNSVALVLGTSTIGQNLTISSGGTLTQTGAITATGGITTISLTTASSDILLPLANNFGVSVPTLSGTLSNIRDVNFRNINAGATVPTFPGTLTNLRNITLAFDNAPMALTGATLTNGGNLSLTAGGPITQSGVLTVPGTSSFSAGNNPITLTQANAFTGAVTLSNSGATNNVSITNSIGLVLAASSVGNNLIATATGAITQTGILTIPGTANFSAGNNAITLTQNNLFTGAVALNNSGANDVSITNNRALIFATSSVGRNLTTVANGAITQSGGLTVPGTASFSAGSNVITLTQNNAFTGAVTLSNSGVANNVSITNSIGLVLAASSVGNNLTVSTAGPITQTGILTVPGTSTFNAGANAITLTQNNLFSGAVSLTNSGANNVSITNNKALVLGTSTFGNDLTVTANGAITQTGAMTVQGNSIFNAGANPITLTENNTFVGTVTLNNTGANDISITTATGIALTTLNAGNNFTVVANGPITQSGVLTVAGASSFSSGANPITLTQNNAFTGPVTLNNSGINDVSITNSIDLILGTSSVGNNLSVTATGAISQTGLLTVPGLSSFNAGANAITLTQNNLFTGAVTLTNSGANDVSITNNRVLSLAATSLGNNLTVIANGAITQTGVLTVAGTASFTAGSNPITLAQNNMFTGAVGLNNSGANDASITNSTDLILATTNIGNHLTVNASGSITQTGVITVGGDTSFTAGANPITLTQNNLFTGGVSLSNSGANDVSITNTIGFVFGTTNIGQNFTIVSGGNITQSGIITFSGIGFVSLTSPNSDIILPLANDLGTFPPDPIGNLANIRDINFRNINAGATLPPFSLGLTNLRNLTVVYDNAAAALAGITLHSGGSISITAGGPITQTGALVVPGTSNFNAGNNPITLTQANAFSGEMTLSNSGANDVSVTNTTPLIFAASTLGRDLIVTNSGAITQTGALTVPGAASFTAGAFPITLTQNNTFTGAVSLNNSGANNVSITNTTGLIFAASTLGNNLSATAAGAITQTGVLTVPGISSFTAGSNPITLTQNNAFTGAVSFSNSGSNNVSVTNSAGLVFGASDIGNNLIAIASGPITQTVALTIPGTSSFSSGSNPITLTQNNVLTGAVTLNNSGANDVSITNTTGLILAGATLGRNLTANATGAITQTGVLTVAGLSSFSSGTNPITLTQNNVFTGAVTLNNSGTNNVDINNTTGLIFATSSLGNNLTANASGAITQTGLLTIPGTASFSAGANAITLTQNNLITGAVTLSNSGINDVSVTNNRDLILAASTVGNNLTVIANGAISQTGVLTIPGTSNFSAGAHPITLTQLNLFTGAVSVNNSGNNDVRLTSDPDLILAASTVGNDYIVSADGAITQTGILTVGGATNITTGAFPITLTLNNALTGAVSLNNSGNNTVSLTNSLPLLIAASNVGGGFDITAGGSITQNGIITSSGGPKTLTLTAPNSDIILPLANDFGGTAVSFAGTLGNIRDINVRNISASAVLPAVGPGLTNLTNLTLVFDNAPISLPGGTLHNGGNLSLTAGGAITQSGALTVPGTSSFIAGNNAITLTQNNVLTGAITLSNSGANDISVTNTTNTILTAATIGRNLIINGTGAITQTGILTVPGTASFSAGAFPITLTQNNHFTGAISLNNSGANDVSIINTVGIIFDTSTLGNNLTATASGPITQIGAITVPGTSSLTAGANPITLTQSNVFTGAVTLSNSGNNNVDINNNTALLFAASTIGRSLNVTANGAITQTGALTVPGVSSFVAGANPIILTQNNTFTGAITFSNSGINNVSITNNTALILGTSSLGNNLIANANGSITQTGVLTIPGTSSFSAGSNPITLTQNNLLTGAIALSNSGSNDVTINNNTSLALSTSSIGRNLIVTANGSITQNGVLTVPGASSFIAGANPIILTKANQFSGVVTISNSGANNVSITNGIALALGSTTVGQDLNIISGGNLTQSLPMTVGGTTTIASTAGSSSVTLGLNNDFGANWPSFSGTTSNIINLTLKNITASAGNLNLAALNNLQNVQLLFPNSTLTETGLKASVNANLQGNDILGDVDVKALQLGTNFCDLTGFVNGLTGIPAIQATQLLNTITAGTHFFDGIDMFTQEPPTPPAPPTPEITPIVINTVASNLYFGDTSNTLDENYIDSWMNENLRQEIEFMEENVLPESCISIGGKVAICGSGKTNALDKIKVHSSKQNSVNIQSSESKGELMDTMSN